MHSDWKGLGEYLRVVKMFYIWLVMLVTCVYFL